MTFWMAVLFPALLLLAVPVAHALLMAGGLAVVIEGRVPLQIVAQRVFSPTQSFPMLAIPFFILAGSLVMEGRFGEYLINFAKYVVGRFRGGMAQVSVLGSAMFGGVSGSAVADATALGNALIPMQKREGYPAGFAAAVNAASSTASVLIPPSIPLILYGLVSETSIVQLFIAGLLPAAVLVALFLLTCWVVSVRTGLAASPLEGGWRTVRKHLAMTLPALFMPVFVIGTLRFGVATPTEVAVMAVFYVLIVKLFVYRDFTVVGAYRAIITSGITTGAVMLIIMASGMVQWILSLEGIPVALAHWALGTFGERVYVIAAMIVLMLIVGTVLDLPAAILLLAPIFSTVAGVIDLHPVQLGIMMVLTLSIGLYTPPVGTTLYISTGIAGNTVGNTVRNLLPFYFVALLTVVIISYVPQVSLFFLSR